jgi:glycosyltransferase involved in cell wall biosynthesis
VISFCIPAYNEERLLPATLASIHRASRSLALDYEIVVADDASTDSTRDVALAASARVVAIDRRQIAAARNAAARAAHGEVLFFVDADTTVHAAALRQALALIDVGCVGGGAIPRFDGDVPLWATILLETFGVPYRMLRLSAGAFMFCTIEAFQQSGGFDETVFGGEEVLFAMALKRAGRFRLVRDRVVTSGRKARAHSFGEVMRALGRIALKGRRGVESREGLDMWYAPRRHERGADEKTLPSKRSP